MPNTELVWAGKYNEDGTFKEILWLDLFAEAVEKTGLADVKDFRRVPIHDEI